MREISKNYILLLVVFCGLFLLLSGCGRKGAPTLKSFEKPEPVKDIKAVHRDGKIHLSWLYAKTNPYIVITGFRLYRAEDSGAYREIAALDPEMRAYVDVDIRLDRQYKYKLRVVTSRKIESEDSVVITARPVRTPEIPSGIVYRIVGENVEIRWNEAEEGTFFNIYKSSVKGTYQSTPLNEKPLDRPFFRDRLNLKSPVYYAVVAFRLTDIVNESALSAELVVDPSSFKPKAPVDLRYVRSGSRGYLTWKESDEPYVRGYRVYRRMGSGDFQLLGEIKVPVFIDETPVDESASYFVTAFGPMKESEPSAEVKVGKGH